VQPGKLGEGVCLRLVGADMRTLKEHAASFACVSGLTEHRSQLLRVQTFSRAQRSLPCSRATCYALDDVKRVVLHLAAACLADPHGWPAVHHS